MKYLKFIPFLIVLSFLFFSSCKKETELPVDMGYKYFPVNTGHWVIYDVDSVSYNDFTGQVDSFKFQIKEIVESVFTDNEGRETQRLERYKKLNDNSNWYIKDVWTENLTASTAEKVEENDRIIKLIFPPHESEKWDGNLYNTLDEQNYTYKDVHSSYLLNNLTFDSTLTVIQQDFHPIIHDYFEMEVYAAHIGLIYKKYVDLSKEASGVIIKGTDYSYTLNSYGNY
jgi:hypothetical protein